MAATGKAKEMGRALVIASGGNQIINICRLVSQGADVNYEHRSMDEGAEKSMTPLIIAAGKGHAGAVRVLISRGAVVDKPEICSGRTALHFAIEFGHEEAAVVLLDYGDDVNARVSDIDAPKMGV